MPASGGTPTQLAAFDKSRGEDSLRWPVFLPDGKHYLYLAANFTGLKGVNAIYVGSLGSHEKRFVVEATANAAYAAPGYLLFYRDKTLLAQPFDLKRFALTGEATTILPEIQFLPQVKRAVFAVSDHGLLVAQSGTEAALSQPVWFDRKGNALGSVGKPDVYGNVFLAPHGRSVAVDKTDMGSLNIDIWTYELQRDGAKRLTFDPAIDAVPVWSPDASRLVFSSNRQLLFGLYVKDSDAPTMRRASCRKSSPTFRVTGPEMESTSCTAGARTCGSSLSRNSRVASSCKRLPSSATANSRPTENGWRTRPTRPASGRFT